MDNDFWFSDVADTTPMTPVGARGMRSPGLSSGYCSSEENHVDGAPKGMNWRPSSPDPTANEMSSSLLKPVQKAACQSSAPKVTGKCSVLIGSSGAARTVSVNEKRNAVFYIGSQQQRKDTSGVRRVTPRRQSPAATAPQYIIPKRSNSQSSLSRTMLILNRHLASELGDSMSTNVDDCKIDQQRTSSTKRRSSCMSVDPPAALPSRSQCSTLPASVIRPLARARGAAALASCTTILRHSATVPNKMHHISGQGVIMRCSPLSTECDSSMMQSANQGCSVKSAVSTVSVHDALRDHIYASKSPPPLTGGEPGWSRKMRASRVQRHSADGYIGGTGKMSILEAFLRSTTSRFDANRGSTELALEELAKLRVTNIDAELSIDIKTEVDDDETTTASCLSPPSLLKQLLTGEVTESELDCERIRSEIKVEACSPNLPVDSLLTDGFGLDANLQLDDPLSNGIGLLGGGACVEHSDALKTDDRVSMTCDISESIREQLRQDGLWWQHYTDLL